MRALSILILTLFILACNESNIKLCPEYTFIEPFPKRSIDLRKRLGKEFLLEKIEKVKSDTTIDPISGDTNIVFSYQKDTNIYSIRFNRFDRTNTILDTDEDTVFHGLISVYRGLYYMSAMEKDSCWWIGSMDIGIDSICGLEELWGQMCDLDFYIKEHPECELIYKTDTVKENYQLTPDKNLMREFYTTILANYSKYRIINT